MAQGGELDFPADLFYPILLHIKDLTFLWTVCRAVSRDFAAAAEHVFIARHLSKTWLIIDGGCWYSNRHGKLQLSSEFSFDRMDPSNPSRAIFSDKECATIFHAKLAARLRTRLKWGNPPHCPKVLVQIRRQINDTAVPDLEVDYDSLKLSFAWKGLYNAFFREEREFERRRQVVVSEMTAQVERNEGLGTTQAWGAAFGAHLRSLTDNRNALRRERICREVWEKEGVTWKWDDGEDEIEVKALQDRRNAIQWESPYSDESDDGKDGEDDDEGSLDEDEGSLDDASSGSEW
ncbi:hypothetical protein FPV67DRAFT_1669328 [Lyophyllum atratum]|nr:hypothetical protein FPV67DRAFT_1669328 [Lyophyllum atratum]